jgi:hypothetical protein
MPVQYIKRKYSLKTQLSTIANAALGCTMAVGWGLVMTGSPILVTLGMAAFLCAVPLLGIKEEKKYTVIPDWMTALLMRRSTAADLRSTGLTRIQGNSSLNIYSEEYLSLALETVEFSAVALEQGFQFVPASRPGVYQH